MSETEADKRRNKLGYQRISVACAHCRRRKIRCTMADGDPQNRCSNCIRLGKQCTFIPVDQAGPTGSLAGSSSRKTSTTSIIPPAAPSAPSSSSAAAASHSPSSELAVGRPFAPNTFPNVPPIPANVQGYTNIAFEGAFPVQGADYGYQPPEYLRQWSAAGDLSPATQAVMAGPVGGFATNSIGHFSPFPVVDSIHSTPTDARSYSFPTIDDPRHWQMYHQQQQGRAMSYGNIEAMQATYAQPAPPSYNIVPVQSIAGTPFGLPSLNTHNVQLQPASGPHSAPVSAVLQPQFGQVFPYAYHQPRSAVVPQAPLPEWYAARGNVNPYAQGPNEGEDVKPRTQR